MFNIIMMQLNKKQILLFFLVVIGFVYSNQVKKYNPKPIIKVSEQDRQINFDHQFVDAISLGQRRLLSSLFWIQTLLDGDTENYKSRDLNSWMFLRFNTITELDPKFYEAYLWGGQYLSIVKDDIIGAERIYEKGLKNYPLDIDLNFNAGFNRYFELGQVDKAIQNFKTVIDLPGGIEKYPRLVSMVNKMSKNQGVPYEEIFANIYDKYTKTIDPKIKKYLTELLYSVRATQDLECLNAGEKNCRQLDLNGSEYIKKNGKYFAARPFQPFKLYKKEN